MVKVTYKKNSLKAEGHTGERGKSLLCCAVSTLMWGLATALENEGVHPKVDMGDGYHSVEYKGKRDVKRLFEAYAVNLQELSEQNPEEISFEIN